MGFDLMRAVSMDAETHRFRPGLMAPPVVCASTSRFNASGEISGELLVGPRAFVDRLRFYLENDYLIAFANAAYDLLCAAQIDPTLLPLIFKALAAGNVHDVLISEALHAIFGGYLGLAPSGTELRKPSTGEVTNRYSLEVVLHLVRGRVDAKLNDALRESYALLEGFPEDSWPPEARQYPVDDSNNTLDAAAGQIAGVHGPHLWVECPQVPGQLAAALVCKHCGVSLANSEVDYCDRSPLEPRKNLHNLAFQVEADFCLKLGAAHSLRTDPAKVEALAAEVEEKYRVAVERFQKKGWVRTGQHAWHKWGAGLRCRRCGRESAVEVSDRCLGDPSDGTEDQAAVKRSLALAYGAAVPCARCGGRGRVPKVEVQECRGEKVRGRYQGCLDAACQVCRGLRTLEKVTGDRTCKYAFDDDGSVLEVGCDGTGFDLNVVPMLPRADKLGVRTDRDAKMESGDEDMADYGEDEFQKSRTTYVPYLRTGTVAPLKIEANVLVASGRCSYENCPIHQFPREGGERECIRARGAWCGYPIEMVLGSTDYAAGELCTLSQYTYWLFGYSEMLEAINRAGDPGILHSELAAEVLGLSLDEFLKRLKAKEKEAVVFRQAQKPMNFGKPAAMGSAKIVLTSRKKNAGFTVCDGGPARNKKGEPGYWGVRFCVTVGGARVCGSEKLTEWKGRSTPPVCRACTLVVENVLTPAYFRRFPEMKDYHRWGAKMVEKKLPSPSLLWDPQAGKARIVRERGGCDLSSFLNNPFQSMLADIGKHAYVRMTRECYLGVKEDGSPSPLAGCRVPIFMHDEPISELILETAHLSGPRIAEIMMDSGRMLAPHVTWKADTALSFYLNKSSEPKHVDGKLVPWDADRVRFAA